MKSVLLLLMLTLCLTNPGLAQKRDPNKPNPALTPGATSDATREDLCRSGYTSPGGDISITLKRQTFDRYGLKPTSLGYNVDHLIPTSLGGSSAPKNLWPQPLSGEWTYQMKNSLERRLHKMVCREAFPLEQAQKEIAADWVTAYKKYILTKNASKTARNNKP